jgi:hypothetical protein
MPIGTAIVDWQGVVPMLLKADGSPYAGVTYVRGYVPGHQRKFPEITGYSDNDDGFALMGNSKGRIPKFTIECWSVGAMQGVMNDVFNPENEGNQMLEVPDLDGGGVERHIIRIMEYPDFDRIYPRRAGFIEVFAAEVSDIRVID